MKPIKTFNRFNKQTDEKLTKEQEDTFVLRAIFVAFMMLVLGIPVLTVLKAI